jgi:hypothetical protein
MSFLFPQIGQWILLPILLFLALSTSTLTLPSLASSSSVCDHLKTTRRRPEYEEGKGRYQLKEDGPVKDLPICLIRTGFPCISLLRNEQLADEEGKHYLKYIKGLVEKPVQEKQNEYQKEDILRELISWICVSGKCTFAQERGMSTCSPGKRESKTSVWRLYAKRDFRARKPNNSTANTGKRKGSSAAAVRGSSYILLISVSIGIILACIML